MKKTNEELSKQIFECACNPARWIELSAILSKYPSLKYDTNNKSLSETVIHWACITDISNIIDLQTTQADLQIKDKEGATPLDWAIEKLFFLKSDIHNELNIDLEAKKGIILKQEEIIHYLLSFKPNITECVFKYTDIIEILIKTSSLKLISSFFIAYGQKNSILFDGGNSIAHLLAISLFKENIKNENNLLHSIFPTIKEAIQFYLDNKLIQNNITYYNDDLQTPIHILILDLNKDNLEVKEKLIEFYLSININPHETDRYGDDIINILNTKKEFIPFINKYLV